MTERAQSVYSFFGQAAPPQAAFRPAPRPSTPYTPRPQPAGRVVPEPDESAVPRRPIKRGSRVRHPTLGAGVVLEMDGQGEEMRITVFFEKAGERKAGGEVREPGDAVGVYRPGRRRAR
ncbi:MAG TPA: hypothetical protein VF179_15415 [Thermoanaerobaculia bacterium]|nr:hypothetical protein [Thermoanaerobaculia bacterium]